MKNLWFPMIKYILIFIILHNLFLYLNIYSTLENEEMIISTSYYSIHDIIDNCCSTLFQTNYPVELAGAMWFVLPLIVATTIFCVINKLSLIITNNEFKRQIILGIIVFALGIIGIICAHKLWKFSWRVDVALFSLPILFLGNIYKKISINKIRWYIAIMSLIVIAILYKKGYIISYVDANIGNPIKFFAASLSGIYLNLYLSYYLNKIKYINSIIACFGKNSFHIMALHFLSFKAANVFDILINNKPIYYIAKYPYSNGSFWIINLLCGLILPIVLITIIKLYKNKYLKINRKYNLQIET